MLSPECEYYVGCEGKLKSRILNHTLASIFLAAISIAPQAVLADDVAALCDRAAALSDAGNKAGAVRLYSIILSHAPATVAALTGRADINFTSARYKETVADERRLIAIVPNYQHGLLLLAISLDKLNDMKQAAFYFKKATALAGAELPTAYCYQALSFLKTGDVKAARATVDKAFKAEPKIPTITKLIQSAQLTIENYHVLPGPVSPDLQTALQLEMSGQDAKSLEALDKVIAAHPSDASAYALKSQNICRCSRI